MRHHRSLTDEIRRGAVVHAAVPQRRLAALWGTLAAGAALALALAAMPAGAGQGHDAHHGHDAHAATANQATAGEATFAPSEGEIKRVDKASKRITIAHGPLENLGMPPMTMAFEVDDPAQLDTLKPGDRIRFIAGKQGRRYTASEIRVQD